MALFSRISDWYFSKNSLPYWCILLVDCAICYVGGLFVFWMFFRGAQTLANILPITLTLLTYIVVNLVFFKLFHTYSGIIRYSSFVDLRRVGYAMLSACATVLLLHYVVIFNSGLFVPYIIPLHSRHIIPIYVISTIGMWGVRVLVKSLYDVSFSSEKGLRTMIYGVRDGGIAIGKSIRNEKPSRFQLKGFIANEPNYQGLMLLGVKTYEVNDKLAEALTSQNIQAVLVSPLQNEAFRNDDKLQDMLISAGVRIYMAPRAVEVKAGEVPESNEERYSVDTLKEVNIEDLLPRNEIEVDMEAIGELLTGKKIMVTGSAGSIGSEILRQISDYRPAELLLIDLAETPQHDIRLMMARRWPDIKTTTIVGSITNQTRMERLFQAFRPDYVFHAAAYKHVPMMENNPSESVQNNVYGTKVIADLSVKYGVKKFVMLSTDKAVNPTNVMGCSKRICEIYVQALNNSIHSKTQFVTTRFGNVLGSNGSVIPLFERQIKAGGPVTVTDENIIRYFMLIPEACKLVLEAGTHGKGGEIFVFDMGKPIRIADLAKRMILLSGAKNVQIKYTGLRPGEKLYEELLSTEENTVPSFHSKIRIAKVREYDYADVERQVEELMALSQTYDDMAIVAKMKEMVPEFVSNNSQYSVLDHE